ncbi:adenylate/guanylate cyclase domain-containing protein [Sneathiella sp. HT1-7]|jgi:adenylate cyclase|uniref:adenylate/guanylate cyclase domain-containing protein n=1 Tax=Sneathiella sp. HT1-7 TaxID=2887192 RepID=UPI001D15DF10|nr:adenylate/guanylate cyclase domain-containing protein [Sneathiella sp. HT1-7]MCC3306509.1 adenylate/guanylate cyclase domain-containing protein [Sneathiella sp. HT1-7]
MNVDLDRKLTTILCADVAGYSRLMSDDEGKTLNRLKITREIFREVIDRHGGRIVNMTGDGLVCEFSSVVKAVQCAVEVQNTINKENASLPANDQMLYRIGINLGDVIIEEDDIFGDGVNVAARLEAMAPVGGICISGSVFDQVKNKLPREFKFLGNKGVKNIAEPVAVYSLSLSEMPDKQPHSSTYHIPLSDGTPQDTEEDTEEDKRIRAYVKRQAGFYRRALTFGTIILFLFVINMTTSPNYWWFLWPAGPFLFILITDAVRIFGIGHRAEDWEKRKVAEIKSHNRKRDR